MINIKEMSKDEKSLLLFLETRAVDYGGRVNIQHVNKGDMEIASKWNATDFLYFGKIVIRNHNSDGTHWVHLSDEAFKIAHQLRLERVNKMYENRTWISTEDSMKVHGNPHLSGLNHKE